MAPITMASTTLPAAILLHSPVFGGRISSALALLMLSRRLLIWFPVLLAVGIGSSGCHVRTQRWYSGLGSKRRSDVTWERKCLCLTSLLNIWGHIAIVPVCSSDTLANMLPHRNDMPQTQDTTPLPVTVYRHRADLSLCYPLMWNVTLEYTATHFNVLGKNRPGNPSRPSTKTSEHSTLYWENVDLSYDYDD